MLALSSLLTIFQPSTAFSQAVAPSRVTPQTLRPSEPNAPGSTLQWPDETFQAARGPKDLSFIVGRVVVEGAFPELDSETRTLRDAVEGARITVAQVYASASALEQAYARAGYVLVRVVVPAQKLNDHGVLHLTVVDGFIEAVQFGNIPDRLRVPVAERTAALVGRRHIKLDDIERLLLIASDAPGLRLKSTLARGTTSGGVLLVLEGTYQPVSVTASADNNLPRSLGTWSYGGSVAVNSPFGFGEQFYASAQAGGDPERIGDSTSPLRVLGAGAALPLGSDGWILNPEYTNSRSQPVPTYGSLASVGQFERFALRTSYPLMRTRNSMLSLNGAFEFITQHIALPLFAVDLNKDRYGVLRGGAAYEAGLPWWGETLQMSATLSHGTGGRDGADAAATGIPLSQQGASPLFGKANFDFRLIQPLPEGFRLDVIGRGQSSFGRPMLISEQFALDGAQAVSAYPNGALNVDEGSTLRGELSRPFALQGFGVPLILSPYSFAAYGLGRLIEPTIVEPGTVRGGAVGAGLRGNIDLPGGYQGATLGLEAARQYSNLPDLARGWRANLSVSIQF